MTILTAPAQINSFRFASLKGMLKMEQIGMKTRGGALRPRLAKEFGLSPRAPYADYISYCVKKIEEACAQ